MVVALALTALLVVVIGAVLLASVEVDKTANKSNWLKMSKEKTRGAKDCHASSGCSIKIQCKIAEVKRVEITKGETV